MASLFTLPNGSVEPLNNASGSSSPSATASSSEVSSSSTWSSSPSGAPSSRISSACCWTLGRITVSVISIPCSVLGSLFWGRSFSSAYPSKPFSISSLPSLQMASPCLMNSALVRVTVSSPVVSSPPPQPAINAPSAISAATAASDALFKSLSSTSGWTRQASYPPSRSIHQALGETERRCLLIRVPEHDDALAAHGDGVFFAFFDRLVVGGENSLRFLRAFGRDTESAYFFNLFVHARNKDVFGDFGQLVFARQPVFRQVFLHELLQLGFDPFFALDADHVALFDELSLRQRIGAGVIVATSTAHNRQDDGEEKQKY